MKKSHVILTFALTSLSACVVEEPRHGYYAPTATYNVEYRDDDWDDRHHDFGHGHYYHCPPGQAKKGNC